MATGTKKKAQVKKKTNGTGRKSVTFHYIKSSDFKSIHVDGAIGSVTPHDLIHVAFYCERPAIPKEIVFEVRQNGVLGHELDRSSKAGFVREMLVDAFMTLDTAESMHVWLAEKIKTLKEQKEKKKISLNECRQERRVSDNGVYRPKVLAYKRGEVHSPFSDFNTFRKRVFWGRVAPNCRHRP